MFKISMASFLCLLCISPNNVKAMLEDQEYAPLSSSPSRVLLKENVIEIAEYIYDQDFHSFASTCKPIRTLLMNYYDFLSPEDDKAIKSIQDISVTQMSSLILLWSRIPSKKSIPFLRRNIENYNNFYPKTSDENEKDFKILKSNFKNYVKILNLLYSFGDNQAKSLYRELYENTQIKFQATIEIIDLDNEIIINPELYKFYFKQYAHISAEMRKSLSSVYENGLPPFEKNIEKSIKYSSPLILPLCLDNIF